MGRVKTEKEKAEKMFGALKAQKMAEAFAMNKTHEMLKKFLIDSEIANDMYQVYMETKEPGNCTLTKEDFTDILVKDYEQFFGGAMALSYAMGYVDCHQGVSIKKLYVPGNLASVKEDEVDSNQPPLPGIGSDGSVK